MISSFGGRIEEYANANINVLLDVADDTTVSGGISLDALVTVVAMLQNKAKKILISFFFFEVELPALGKILLSRIFFCRERFWRGSKSGCCNEWGGTGANQLTRNCVCSGFSVSARGSVCRSRPRLSLASSPLSTLPGRLGQRGYCPTTWVFLSSQSSR